jgi:hypothetical protein
MKFSNYFIASVLIILLALSGCKGGTSLSNRRVPVINQQYMGKDKKFDEHHSHYNKSDENYYAFNAHKMPVSYFEEKKTKEVFHPAPKKAKKKKPAKIYKKLPKKPVHHQQKVQEVKKEEKKSIVKVSPKKDNNVDSDKPTVPVKITKDSKKEVKILNSPKPHKLKSISKKISHRKDDSKKLKYDLIEWPKNNNLPSGLELEKNIAYLEQDIPKKENDNLAKLKPKTAVPLHKKENDNLAKLEPKAAVPHHMKEDRNQGSFDTYDVESRPIPLPFK